METEFKDLETAIFHINDKGNADDKTKLLEILKHKLELQKSIIDRISISGDKVTLRNIIKQEDKKNKTISKWDILKKFKINQTDLDRLILEMLQDGEIYEIKPKMFRWLG